LKRVLIVSPHFPPVNAPDCQRVRMSLPYYRRFGWDPVVLAVDPRHREDWRDESLLESLPADVPVHLCEAFSRDMTRWVGINNLGIRCVAQLNRTAHRLLGSEHFDLVFFTTTQYLVTPLGRLWLRRYGVPYVVDLQDPWRSDYYERPGAPRPPGGWKYQFARFTAWLFEGRTFGQAAGLVSVSPHYFDDLRKRYGWPTLPPHQVIPFGGPQADFERIAAHPAPVKKLPELPAGVFNWVSTGSLGPPFSHALRVLFSGLRRLRDQDPAAAQRVRLHFIGTSYADPTQAVASAKPIAEAYGVGDLVTEQTRRIGYTDSLRLMSAADGLLLLGTDDPAYSPSKIYPYYMARKPVLALTHDGSVLQTLLRRLNCARTVDLLRPGRELEPPREVQTLLAASARGDLTALESPRCDAWFDRNLTALAATQRQCAVFDAALQQHSAR